MGFLNPIVFFLIIFLSWGNTANAQSLQNEFQKAVETNNCHEVKRLLPELAKIDSGYYLSLGHRYKTGLCFPQNYQKAIEAYSKAPHQTHPWALYQLGFLHEYGKGVARNTQKAIDFYKRGLQQTILKTVDFSLLRPNLQVILEVEPLPIELDKLVQKYESLEDDHDQKLAFALDYLDNTPNSKKFKAGVKLLKHLAYINQHAKSAYHYALYQYEQNAIDEGFYALAFSALMGDANAQAKIGHLEFQGKTPSLNRVFSYSMLLRAHAAGTVSSQELSDVRKKLLPEEIEWAEEKAANPLPPF